MKIIPLRRALDLPLLFGFIASPDSPSADLVRRDIYPPLPVRVSSENSSGMPVLIWGRAVLEAARGAGAESVMVREIGEKDLPPPEALRLCLLLENRKDRYSWEEMEGIADYMERAGILDDGSIAALVSSESGLRHIPRFRDLDPALKRLVREGKTDLKTAEHLGNVPSAVFEALASVLDLLSFSERRIFLKSFSEIIQRDGLDETSAFSLCHDLSGSKKPLEKLHRLRYPELSSLEDRFTAVVSRALKGSGVTLKPPPCFEGSRYSVSFEFDGGRALKKKIRALENLAAEEAELFDLL